VQKHRVSSIPTIQPTPWQGNTSGVSSIDVFERHNTNKLIITAATSYSDTLIFNMAMLTPE